MNLNFIITSLYFIILICLSNKLSLVSQINVSNFCEYFLRLYIQPSILWHSEGRSRSLFKCTKVGLEKSPLLFQRINNKHVSLTQFITPVYINPPLFYGEKLRFQKWTYSYQPLLASFKRKSNPAKAAWFPIFKMNLVYETQRGIVRHDHSTDGWMCSMSLS